MEHDLPDEIEPAIPSSDDLAEFMEQYKKNEESSPILFLSIFVGIIAFILFTISFLCP